VHAGMSYGSSRSHGLSAISDEKYASHANHAVMGNASDPEEGSKATTTKFRVVLTSLLGLDLPVAVVRGPDTTMPHSSDILHLIYVSYEANFVLGHCGLTCCIRILSACGGSSLGWCLSLLLTLRLSIRRLRISSVSVVVLRSASSAA
jgi:hypothetical protein